MRDDAAAFERNVASSLRGGTLRIARREGGVEPVTFERLL